MTPGQLVPAVDVELLHKGGPMRIVAFASGTGTNFREAVLASKGANFSIDLLITDRETKRGQRIGALKYADQFGIPAITVPYKSYPDADAFNLAVFETVRNFELQHGHFDFAVLVGYMRVIRGPLLRRFYRRAINVHPAGLDVLNVDGSRMYRGADAFARMISNHPLRIRSTVHLIDDGLDTGPILATGPYVHYGGPGIPTAEVLERYLELQKQKSDWPTLRFVLQAIAEGKYGVHRRKTHFDGNPVLTFEYKELPYSGVDLGHGKW